MMIQLVVAALALTTKVNGLGGFSLSSSIANATSNGTDVTSFTDTTTAALGDDALATGVASGNAILNRKDEGGFVPTAASLSQSTSAILNGFVDSYTQTDTAVQGEGSLAGSQADSAAKSISEDKNGDIPEAASNSFSLSSFKDRTGILASQTNSFAAGKFAKANSTSNAFAQGKDTLLTVSTASNTLGSIFGGGSNTPTPSPTTPTPTPTPTTTPTPTPAPGECNTLADFVTGVESLSILAQAVQRAGLLGTLDDPTLQATLLAPVNSAWTALAESLGVTVEGLLDLEALGSILQYHVVTEVISLSELSSGQVLQTLLGETLGVSTEGGSVTFIGAGSNALAGQEAVACEAHIIAINNILLPN